MARTFQGLATIEAAGKHFTGGLTLPRLFRPRAPHVLHPLPLLPNILKRLQLLVLKRNTKDPTYTIRHIVEVMLRDVATLPQPIAWGALLDFG